MSTVEKILVMGLQQSAREVKQITPDSAPVQNRVVSRFSKSKTVLAIALSREGRLQANTRFFGSDQEAQRRKAFERFFLEGFAPLRAPG